MGFGQDVLPSTLPFDFVVARYNDSNHVQSLVDETFAAIIVEPIQSAGGMIVGSKEFLQGLRTLADKTGALLIFDEVVTARLHHGGLQGYYGILPDLTTVGKFFGGGFSFGAFGGRLAIMEKMGPGSSGTGRLHHSGTYNNNAFSMRAGAVACRLMTAEVIANMNALGDRLRHGINEAGKVVKGRPLLNATGFGSAIGLHFGSSVPEKLRDAFFFHMLSRGIYVGKRGFMSLNKVHEQGHVDAALDAVREFVETIVDVNVS